jgi:hypothetical protein
VANTTKGSGNRSVVRAIDFVGQEQVGDDGAAVERKAHGARVEDLRADQIARQHVGGELDARKREAKGGGIGAHRGGLGDAGDAFDQYMTIAERGYQHALEQRLLADDRRFDRGRDAVCELFVHGFPPCYQLNRCCGPMTTVW